MKRELKGLNTYFCIEAGTFCVLFTNLDNIKSWRQENIASTQWGLAVYSSLIPGQVPCESSAIVRASTCTPCWISLTDENSSGRWLTPSLQGMKIMLVGAILKCRWEFGDVRCGVQSGWGEGKVREKRNPAWLKWWEVLRWGEDKSNVMGV